MLETRKLRPTTTADHDELIFSDLHTVNVHNQHNNLIYDSKEVTCELRLETIPTGRSEFPVANFRIGTCQLSILYLGAPMATTHRLEPTGGIAT